MSRTFPPQISAYLKLATFVVAAVAVLILAAITYYGSPAYARLGYEPTQPIAFSHALHAGRLGLDCTYCHNHVGESPHSNVPSTQTCLNCHGAKWGNIKSQSSALAPLREAEETGRPVAWARVHKVPEYAYFHHAVHVGRGVSCVSCHGKINEMEVVAHSEPLTMSWCLECHRNPRTALRPADQVTNLDWTPADDVLLDAPEEHEAFLDYLMDEVGIRPPVHCSGCHR